MLAAWIWMVNGHPCTIFQQEPACSHRKRFAARVQASEPQDLFGRVRGRWSFVFLVRLFDFMTPTEVLGYQLPPRTEDTTTEDTEGTETE
jgi:hypothetical protein